MNGTNQTQLPTNFTPGRPTPGPKGPIEKKPDEKKPDDRKPKLRHMLFKELGIVMCAALFVAALLEAHWYFAPRTESQAASAPAVNLARVGLKPGSLPTVRTAMSPSLPAKNEPIHLDLYFDFGRSRLTAEAIGRLQETAKAIGKDGEWVVLVQGYADQQGPTEYNKMLALRRAENTKQYLVEMGVPETAIKVVTIGKEGAICDDPSKECQRMNRRVHIECVKLPTPA